MMRNGGLLATFTKSPHVYKLTYTEKTPHQILRTGLTTTTNNIPYGLVVRIRRSHRRGQGSIPGVGKWPFSCYFVEIYINSVLRTG